MQAETLLKSRFDISSRQGRIIPGMPISITTPDGDSEFINDAWVTIETSPQGVKIIDAQNWDRQKFDLVVFHDIKNKFNDDMHVYDANLGAGVTPTVVGFLNESTGKRTVTYPYMKDVVDITRYPDGSVGITNAMGTVYIIIHDLETSRINLYKRSPGNLWAQHIDAFVSLKDVEVNQELSDSRGEFGATKRERPVDSETFTMLAQNGEVIPGMPIITGENEFLNDAYVIIEQRDNAEVKIIDAQNWDRQKFTVIRYFTHGNSSYDQLEDTYDVNLGRSLKKAERRDPIVYREISLEHLQPAVIWVTGVMDTLYIFIMHRNSNQPLGNLNRPKIEVYRRDKGTLEAQPINATVQLREIKADNYRDEYGNNRPQYGNGASFSQLDLLVKRKIAEKLLEGGSGTIRYCQTDRNTRRACQLLPLQDKIKMCFDRQGGFPRECDKIPAFTKADFDRWIPREIETRGDETLIFTHDFYPQNYKLVTEGFSQALYKAYWINTICAIARVQVFLEYQNLIDPLPEYLDKAFISRVARAFQDLEARAPETGRQNIFAIRIILSNSKGEKFEINLTYNQQQAEEDNGLAANGFERSWNATGSFIRNAELEQLRTFSRTVLKLPEDFQEAMIAFKNDRYIGRYIERMMPGDSHVDFSSKDADMPYVDTSALSRILKILFDRGYAYSVRLIFGFRPTLYGSDIIPYD